jgi:ribokinase
LVTVGGLTVDSVIGADGTVALAKAGGNGAYSAVGARIWGARVGLVATTVESYPRPAMERLEAAGIDLAGVVWVPETLTSCGWFIYDADGRLEEGLDGPPETLAEAGLPTDRLTPAQVARFKDHLRSRTAPDEVSYSGFRTRHPVTVAQVPEAWLAARGVHIAPSRPDAMLAMRDRFKAGGVLVTADPGWQLAERDLDEITPLLAGLDAFLPSEVELRALVPDAGVGDALAVLADRCPGAIAVKMGPRGALVWDRARRTPVPVPAETVPTVDPTGAGDGFCGGFLAGLCETGDPVLAARYGALSAARIVACYGADGALPTDRPTPPNPMETP